MSNTGGVHYNGIISYGRALGTKRINISRNANFSDCALSFPFAKGSQRYAALGHYYNNSERCVCKWPIAGHVNHEAYFEADIRMVKLALKILESFNRCRIIDRVVRMNIPDVVTIRGNRKVLLERYINGAYEKFNSNGGWWRTQGTPGTFDLSLKMQALSHFSYHITGRNYLLCDLQGAVTEDGRLVLTDPAILSNIRTQYGDTDLGPEGIDRFFYHHQCNQYCQHDWLKPIIPAHNLQPVHLPMWGNNLQPIIRTPTPHYYETHNHVPFVGRNVPNRTLHPHVERQNLNVRTANIYRG